MYTQYTFSSLPFMFAPWFFQRPNSPQCCFVRDILLSRRGGSLFDKLQKAERFDAPGVPRSG